MRLIEQQVLFLDCQSTGPNPIQGNLLEIAWAAGTAKESCHSQSYIIKQPEDSPVPRRIQILTGITQESMLEAVEIDHAREQLKSELSNAPICVAHFARFEKPFLRHLFELMDGEELPFQLLCSHEIAKRLYPNLPSKGIRAVAGFFGTTCGELKRADSHIEATAAIWKGVVDALAGEGIETIEALLDWLRVTPQPKRSKFEYPLDKAKRLILPDLPGVYRMLSRTGSILYVGKATSLKQRVNSYFRGQRGKDSKTKELLSQVYDLDVTVCSSPMQAALLETDEIKKWDPPYNRALKRSHRSLLFYSDDLSSSSETQDDVHRIGPFANSRILEPLMKLSQSLQNKSFATDIFFYELPEILLSEGFALFCINEGLERSSITTSRSLLALALWLERREMRIRAEAERERIAHEAQLETTKLDGAATEIGDELEATTIDEMDDENLSSSDSDVVSAEEIGEKYGRMLRRIAKSHMRSKALTKLLDSEIELVHKNETVNLRVSKGTLISSDMPNGELQSDSLVAETSRWSGLGIDTYDRMSVMLTELTKKKLTFKEARQLESTITR